MYLVMQILVTIITIFLILVVVGILYWSTPTQSLDVSNYLDSDIKIVRDVITNDSYLHRLLMIEIINKDNPDNSTDTDENPMSNHSEIITFKKISNSIDSFGRSLIRSFGGATSQRLTSLMHQRNNIIRDYYKSMREVVCHKGNCVHVINVPSDNPEEKTTCVIRPLTSTDSFFPSGSLFCGLEKQEQNSPIEGDGNNISVSSLDITTITLRKLDVITREIVDNIAATFHIKDVDDTNFAIGSNSYRNKRPIIHYERLFNLMTMYNKELLNQAKSYASKQYNISMNCSQSSLEITHHISDEFGILMRDAFKASIGSTLGAVVN